LKAAALDFPHVTPPVPFESTTDSVCAAEFPVPDSLLPDISKARRVLGWEPKVNLEEGLRLTLESFKKRFAETQAR